nr:hypothetical protein [Tanacetum cinerariifolium]
MVRNVDSPGNFLMYPWFLQVIINTQVDDLTSHNTKYTSSALTQKVFANMRSVGKGFSRVETPLFSLMLVQPLPQAAEEEDEVEVSTDPTSPSPTNDPLPHPQDPTPTPYATPPQVQPSTPPASPPQEQPTTTSESSMSLLTTLMEPCATLSKKVTDLEQDKHTQALEILKLKKRGRIDQDDEVNAVSKGFNAVEPTVFDDKEVTITMAQTLIKMKAEKVNLINEQIAQRLHDEKIEKAATREKQEKDDLERAKKYRSLKKKPISIAQARKNMIMYLKNMAGYKMKHFRGMTYDKVRPIFEREYKKVQTLFKPDKDVEEPKKKRVIEETLLQESFKKLKVVEVSGSESTQETPSNDPKEISEEDVQNMLEIVPVSEFKAEALQVKYPIIDWEIHSKGSRTYWKIIRVGGIT